MVLSVPDSTCKALFVGAIMQPRACGVPDPTCKALIVGAIMQPRIRGTPDPIGKALIVSTIIMEPRILCVPDPTGMALILNGYDSGVCPKCPVPAKKIDPPNVCVYIPGEAESNSSNFALS